MALARVITSSDACARELTSALIDYGYTVEVVPPDSTPPHAADLELRVDSSPDSSPPEKLVASVRANTRNHSASLNFVHQLRATAAPVILEMPVAMVEASPIVEKVIPESTIHRRPIPSPIPVEREDAAGKETVVAIPWRDSGSLNPAGVLPEASSLGSGDVSSSREDATVVPVATTPTKEEGTVHHFGNGLGACALALAAVVLPAVLLALSLNPRGISAKPLGPVSGKALESALRASLVRSLSPKTSVNQTAANVMDALPKNATVPNLAASLPAPKPEPVAAASLKSPLSNPKTDGGSRVSVRRNQAGKDRDFVAKNTVTYLDERYRPPSKILTHKKPVRSKHAASRAIAANASKKSKQTSN
jgi:hypothetical protein